MKLESAFKKDAEQIAEDVRKDLGLFNYRAMDPRLLFEALDIPVVSLNRLVEISDDPPLGAAVAYLQSEEASLSATTVFRGTVRIVVFNDAASPERQVSDLAHEAAHGLLLHRPSGAFDEFGCRIWDERIETEAQYLGGCLLIPGKGARYAAKAGWSHEHMTHKFACSAEMVLWRDNVTGAKRLR